MGYNNIVFNMENIKIFDDENTITFTELFKLCNEKGGKFILVRISDAVRVALADAFLDTLIPSFSSVDLAISKIEEDN